jgi:hypothetical protein
MNRKIKLSSIYFMILGMTTAAAITSAAPTPSTEPEWRKDLRNQNTVLKYVGPALKAAKKAGRFYYAQTCKANGEFPVPFPKLKVQAPSKHNKGLEAVREIFRNDQAVTVSEEPDGIIRVKIGRVPAAVLQTKIPLLRLKPREQYTPKLAVMAIKNTKEVQGAISKLALEEPITIYSIALQDPMKGLPHLPATMRDITMDQALDIVAKTFGSAVVFGECTSRAGAHFFRLSIESL